MTAKGAEVFTWPTSWWALTAAPRVGGNTLHRAVTQHTEVQAPNPALPGTEASVARGTTLPGGSRVAQSSS